MRYYAGLDVSLAETSVCVVDEEGKILREAKVASEPEALATWLGALGLPLTRVGLETGALAGWLCEEMTELGVPNVVCMAARHARAAMVAMTHKTDRNDARPCSDAPHRLVPAGPCEGTPHNGAAHTAHQPQDAGAEDRRRGKPDLRFTAFVRDQARHGQVADVFRAGARTDGRPPARRRHPRRVVAGALGDAALVRPTSTAWCWSSPASTRSVAA